MVLFLTTLNEYERLQVKQMNHIADGIIEAAYLTVGDNENAVIAWIKTFEFVVNSELPEGVSINLETCKQEGNPEKFISEHDFENLLHAAEQKVDEIAAEGKE